MTAGHGWAADDGWDVERFAAAFEHEHGHKPGGQDIRDGHAAHRAARGLPSLTAQVVDQAEPLEGQGAGDGGDGAGDGERKASQATLLVELAQERYRVSVSDRGQAFGVPPDGPSIARMLRCDRDNLRAELSAGFVAKQGRGASGQALADALLVLEGRAQMCDREPVALRVVKRGASVVADLGTADGACAIVSVDGWRVVPRPPMLFRCTLYTDTASLGWRSPGRCC